LEAARCDDRPTVAAGAGPIANAPNANGNPFCKTHSAARQLTAMYLIPRASPNGEFKRWKAFKVGVTNVRERDRMMAARGAAEGYVVPKMRQPNGQARRGDLSPRRQRVFGAVRGSLCVERLQDFDGAGCSGRAVAEPVRTPGCNRGAITLLSS